MSTTDTERWAGLYGWLETEITQMDRLEVPAGPDRESISAQAHELRYVREHMRGVDPALPVSEIDRQE
jgi:hypothetical protein